MTERTSAEGGLIAGVAGLLFAAAASAQVAAPGIDERMRAAFSEGSPEAGATQTDADLERAGRAAADRLGVTFLGVSPLEVDDRRLASVRVMEPGGNSNAAFLVQTLVVDPESGEVLGVFPGADARSSDFPPYLGAPANGPDDPQQGEAGDE